MVVGTIGPGERQLRLGREVRRSAAMRVHFAHFTAFSPVTWTLCPHTCISSTSRTRTASRGRYAPSRPSLNAAVDVRRGAQRRQTAKGGRGRPPDSGRRCRRTARVRPPRRRDAPEADRRPDRARRGHARVPAHAGDDRERAMGVHAVRRRRSHPFVHALDTVGRKALCLDLDVLDRDSNLGNLGLRPEPGGKIAVHYRRSSTARPAASRRLHSRSHRRASGRAGPSRSPAASRSP
jgi:hypothetical protein